MMTEQQRLYTYGEFLTCLEICASECDYPEPRTRDEWARAAVEAVLELGGFDCVLCGVDTFDEYYFVRDALWRTHGSHVGMLCVGCLEKQMGRKLTHSDFTKCEVNTRAAQDGSPRLRNRICNGA